MPSPLDRPGAKAGNRLRGGSGFTLAQQLRGRVVLCNFCGAQAVTIGLTGPSAAIATVYGAWDVATDFALMALASLLLYAASATLPAFRRWSAPKTRGSESILLILLILIASAAFLVLPFTTFGFAPLDAWFEAVSSVTSTGLTVATRDAIDSEAFFLIRSWAQWYGGILILVGGPALVLRQSALAKRMGQVQALGAEDQGTTRLRARRMLMVFAGLTLLGFAAVWPLIGDAGDALAYTLSAVSTGGFAPRPDSLAGIDNEWAGVVLMALAIMGAVSAGFYLRIWTRWKSRGSAATGTSLEEFILLLTFIAVVSALLILLQLPAMDWRNADAWDWWRIGALGISAQTTTGFSYVGGDELTDPAKLVVTLSMAIGGEVGSTAGGLKIMRLLVIFAVVRLVLQRAMMPPDAVSYTRLGQHKLQPSEVYAAGAMVALYLTTGFCLTFAFMLYGYPAVDALFESVSALSTAGLSTGITGPDMEPGLKALMSFAMILGRVEIVAVFVVLYPMIWLGRR